MPSDPRKILHDALSVPALWSSLLFGPSGLINGLSGRSKVMRFKSVPTQGIPRLLLPFLFRSLRQSQVPFLPPLRAPPDDDPQRRQEGDGDEAEKGKSPTDAPSVDDVLNDRRPGRTHETTRQVQGSRRRGRTLRVEVDEEGGQHARRSRPAEARDAKDDQCGREAGACREHPAPGYDGALSEDDGVPYHVQAGPLDRELSHVFRLLAIDRKAHLARDASVVVIENPAAAERSAYGSETEWSEDMGLAANLKIGEGVRQYESELTGNIDRSARR